MKKPKGKTLRQAKNHLKRLQDRVGGTRPRRIKRAEKKVERLQRDLETRRSSTKTKKD